MSEANRLAQEMELFGIDSAYEIAVEVDEYVLNNEGESFREIVEATEEGRKSIRKQDYIRAVMHSVVDTQGGKQKVEAIIDNNMVDALNRMTPENRATLSRFNDEVAERIYYGTRDVPVKGTEAYCFWSNGSESWFCRELWNQAKQEGVARLDANELVIEADHEFLNNHRFLMKKLPLFEFSYEAGQTAGVDKRKQIKDWAFKQLESKAIQERRIPEEWL